MMRRQDQAAPARLFVAACSVVATGFILFARSIFGDTLVPQVQIEARIAEVTHSSERVFGMNMRVGETLAKLPPVAASYPVGPDFGLGQNPSAATIGARLFPSNSAPG